MPDEPVGGDSSVVELHSINDSKYHIHIYIYIQMDVGICIRYPCSPTHGPVGGDSGVVELHV